jgi:hypothetical protein
MSGIARNAAYLTALAMVAAAAPPGVAAAPPSVLPTITWGYNYNIFAPIPATADQCMFELSDLLALPSTPAVVSAAESQLRRDFSVMRNELNGTSLRLFVSLYAVLQDTTTVNQTAMKRLQWVVNIAASEQLVVDLTGLAVMRKSSIPAWLADASDVQLHTAHKTFWVSLVIKTTSLIYTSFVRLDAQSNSVARSRSLSSI